MGRLDGKIILITGGARGQGLAEGTLFSGEGATVYLTDIRPELQSAAAATGATAIDHDVTSPDDWANVVGAIMERHRRLDVLVNNAGIFSPAHMTETDLDLWQSIVAVNQTGTFLGMKSVAPIMIEQQSGSIINISSIAGLRGTRVAFAYAASKWAVRGMTKSAALELAADNVRVNSIHPGLIDTAMLDDFAVDNAREVLPQQVPMGRLAGPDDVANLALFLASDESAYCTGSEFIVDGGYVT
jgi:3alpha(or 20beta)-hydroxysteroid dehydrogenase